jgi:hypothetical protein
VPAAAAAAAAAGNWQTTYRLQDAIGEWITGSKSGGYVDVHNYQFTPESLLHLVEHLGAMGLTDLHVHRLYPPPRSSPEFGIVLKKGGGGGQCWRGPDRLSPERGSGGARLPTKIWIVAGPQNNLYVHQLF